MTTKLSSAKEKILVIAEELIESKGYVNLSVRIIAKKQESALELFIIIFQEEKWKSY